MKFTNDKLNELLDAGDAWQASDNLSKILFDKEQREKLFRKFLEVEYDISYDWFYKYFSEELAERTKKKQDFTPPSVAKMLNQMIDNSNANSLDIAAGTGQLIVTKWNYDRKQHTPLDYYPSDYWYQAEELKEENKPSRALPFLLFNFLIRGMNGVVIAGDSLSRTVSQVYFIQNPKDDFNGFSDLNVMPRTEEVEQIFDVRHWIDEPIDHVETQLKDVVHPVKEEQLFAKKVEHVKNFMRGADPYV